VCGSGDASSAAGRPVVYLSGTERYAPDAGEKYSQMKAILDRFGFDALTPEDPVPGTEILPGDNAYVRAAKLFDRWQQHVRDCDILLADLNDFRGYEVSTDVGFECGMAFQLGKKLHGYMRDTSPMIQRVPHLGEEAEFRDQTGSNVENFNYPLNLMFASSMPITEGDFEAAVRAL